jgi:hypothetical protein
MLKQPTILLLMLSRKILISVLLCGVVILSFASIGGGKKNKNTSLTAGFTPVRTNNGFTLKVGPTYRGSLILKQERGFNAVSFNTIITYDRGNITYILPYRYRVPASYRSNLQLLNLKINIRK